MVIIKVKGVNSYSRQPISELRNITLRHLPPNTGECAPRPLPFLSQTDRYAIYLLQRDVRLSWWGD